MKFECDRKRKHIFLFSLLFYIHFFPSRFGALLTLDHYWRSARAHITFWCVVCLDVLCVKIPPPPQPPPSTDRPTSFQFEYIELFYLVFFLPRRVAVLGVVRNVVTWDIGRKCVLCVDTYAGTGGHRYWASSFWRYVTSVQGNTFSTHIPPTAGLIQFLSNAVPEPSRQDATTCQDEKSCDSISLFKLTAPSELPRKAKVTWNRELYGQFIRGNFFNFPISLNCSACKWDVFAFVGVPDSIN